MFTSSVRLLPELVEQILTLHVDSFDEDPAYQWAKLRQISPYQKTRIEKRFYDYWLPELIVTVYVGSHTSFDYTLDVDASTNNYSDRIVPFHYVKQENHRERLDSSVKAQLAGHSLKTPTVHLRLGEGVLNNGMAGGYIVNDTEVTGLEIGEDCFKIRFDWRETFTALLREEMLLRKHKQEMVSLPNTPFCSFS